MNILNNVIKNKFVQIIFIIIVASICAAPPIALKQIYIGEDTLYHILRIEELSKNILNGKIFPYIHSGAIGGYGYASAFFYPELTLIIPALFYIAGFSIITSINVSIIIYNVLAGVIAYFCIKIYLEDVLKEDKNKLWLSLIGALAYIVYPYRLYNIFYRSALNEFIAMCFIPLALLSIYKIFVKKEFNYWKMLSISFSLSLLTHLGVTLMLGMVCVIFFVLNIKILFDKNFIKNIFKAILCSILSTSYFLFPMIEQMISNEFFYTSLPKLNNPKIYANQTIDKKAMILIGDALSQPVLILLNVLLIMLIFKISKKISSKIKNKRLVIILKSTLVFIYIFIMLTDIFPWTTVIRLFPLILKIQFPFRFLALAGLMYSFIIALSTPRVNKNNKITKVIIVILMVINPKLIITDQYMKSISIEEKNLKKIDISWCLGCGEYLPSKIDPEYEKYLKNRGNIVKIKYIDGRVEKIKRSAEESHTNYMFDNIKNDIESIELPLIYYKGYEIKESTNNIQINESSNGFIEIKNIPCEKVYVEIYYKGTLIQSISNIITVVFLSSLLLKQIIASRNLFLKTKFYKKIREEF